MAEKLPQHAPKRRDIKRVAMVQAATAHYRKALFARLDQAEGVEFTFFTSGEDLEGVAHLPSESVKRQRLMSLRSNGQLYWQGGVFALSASNEFDALVFLGNPNFLSTWIAAPLARLTGKPVLFWTHGWRRPESGIKRLVRLAFYRLANRLLIYSERGRQLGIAAGYPADRMTVIYNSLDLDQANAVLDRIERADSLVPPAGEFFQDASLPLLICTARLTELCRFDVLLRAAALMRDRGTPVNILLVGDGPMRGELEALAESLGVDVHFTGAVYDEQKLGTWIYQSDVTVSPGKVGLTAIHSMMYGTPVITHGNLDAQMPEVETIVEGETGAFFKQDDEQDLARVILEWLGASRDRAAIRESCRAVVRDKWSPENQAALIVGAIRELTET